MDAFNTKLSSSRVTKKLEPHLHLLKINQVSGCFPGDKFYNRNSMHFLSVTLVLVLLLSHFSGVPTCVTP